MKSEWAIIKDDLTDTIRHLELTKKDRLKLATLFDAWAEIDISNRCPICGVSARDNVVTEAVFEALSMVASEEE